MTRDLEPDIVRLNESISKKLREYRKNAGEISQYELAKIVGVNQSLISRLESMRCGGCPLSTLSRIFDKMGIDIRIEFVEKEQTPVDQPIRSNENDTK